MTKYKAIKTTIDGITFDSKKESLRYLILRLLERDGQIRGLELQPEFKCMVNGQLICKYKADFAYFEGEERIVEDVKGYKKGSAWATFRLKAKLVKALFNVEIKVT